MCPEAAPLQQVADVKLREILSSCIMHVQLPQCVVRDWRESDKASLIRFGNSRNVWRNLTDAFPHPYT
jgi:hypothetical protein